MTKRKFLYNLSRASYEKNWGKDYQKPTIFERFIALLYSNSAEIRPVESVAAQNAHARDRNANSRTASTQALDRYKARHAPGARRPDARHTER